MTTSLLICARAFYFGSGMILVGVVAFRWLVLLPAFAGETDEAWQKFAPLFRRMRALFMGAGVVLVISGFVLFGAVAAGMSGDSLTDMMTDDTLRTVLFQTQFGFVCQWRLGLAAILGLLMWRLNRSRWPIGRRVSISELAAGFVATALIVSVAWTGHAAAASGPDLRWRILADTTHLFAASIWPTGLLPFALFLGCARHTINASHLSPLLAVARRFSAVSFVVVGILIATGIINTCFIVGNFPALVATDYGRLLCLKLFLFLMILGMAAWNRYHLLPLLFARAAVPDNSLVFALLRRLQAFVATELGLAIGVVIVVSILGITPPPR